MTLIIRKAELPDALHIPRIQIAGWQAAYKDIMPADFLQNMEEQPRIARWSQNIREMTEDTYTILAELDGQVIGFLSIGPAREEQAGFQAELWAIYLDTPYWRGGYGTALFREMVAGLKSRGIKSLYVWVLEDNLIGRGFYKKMGGIEIKSLTKKFILEDNRFNEVAYGWAQL